MNRTSEPVTHTLDHSEDVRRHFAEHHYLVIPGLLTDPLLAVANEYILKRCRFDETLNADDQVRTAFRCYGDPLMETIMELAQPVVENCSGLQLYPSYSYFRHYLPGAELAPHVDRAACEITVSLTLGYEAEQGWPMWLNLPEGQLEVPLDRGDALVFRGCDHEHWRERFPGRYHNQVFLHFVDRNGPNAEWRYDKREDVGAPRPPAGPQGNE